MSWKNSLYILLVIAIAGISALTGAIAGGVIVYRTFQQSASLPAPVQEILPSSNTDPDQTLTFNTSDIETAITQSVEKVGPTVVTVVGTVPG